MSGTALAEATLPKDQLSNIKLTGMEFAAPEQGQGANKLNKAEMALVESLMGAAKQGIENPIGQSFVEKYAASEVRGEGFAANVSANKSNNAGASIA
jgi:hypothetical protein